KGGEAIVQLYLSKFYANKTLLNSLSETFDITMEELGNIGSATINNLYLGILINTQGNEYYSRYTENVDLDLPPNYRYSYIPLEQYNLPSGLSAGTYKLYPMFSASQYGNPTIISSDNGKPYITVTVQSDGKVTLSSDNSKKPNLWLESLQSTGELYQDVSGDFKVEIYNAGTVDYNSNISLQLGSQTIATKKVKVAAGYTETFDLSGKITLSPGNYSLSVKYDPNNTSTATPSELLGSSMIVTVNETPQYAPDAPTLAGKTAASITLNALDGDVEYSKDGVNWQDSPIFDGLAPNTGYTFYARYKGSTVLSKPSKTFTTDKAALSGAVTISGTAKVGETLTAEVSTLESEPKIANLGTISYQWKRNGTDISGATGSAYTLMPADIASAITVTVSTDETQGYLTSDATATVELSNLSVNGISISIVDSQLDYQATCDETSITVSVGLPVAASTTLTATADGVEYSSGKNIPLSKEKEVTEINISISSVDGTTSNEYKLSVANVLEANNILFKRWDDVVAVNRNPANNGGYRNIDGVRWYIANATVSEEWHIQTTGEYSVEISIANRWHQVCGSPEVRSSRLIAYPNPVSTGENLTLQLPKNFTGGYLDVISLTGSTIKQKMPLPDIFKTISVADWAPGIYLLNVVAPDGDREIIKIVVGN
ncbi:MAG: T9SS type A sorting domain-containing protein, partial [Prevotellaceae bacterium]|nr:T9SS type A sorting domain-containing protein [Prevotellaceae bacterium]